MATNTAKQGASHSSQLPRLKRIEGQVRGISKMVEDQRYCLDILQQLKSVRAALARVERDMIEGHLNHCVHDALRAKDEQVKASALNEVEGLLKALMK